MRKMDVNGYGRNTVLHLRPFCYFQLSWLGDLSVNAYFGTTLILSDNMADNEKNFRKSNGNSWILSRKKSRIKLYL